MSKPTLEQWLAERLKNSLNIAATKTSPADRTGWLEDAQYFSNAIAVVNSTVTAQDAQNRYVDDLKQQLAAERAKVADLNAKLQNQAIEFGEAIGNLRRLRESEQRLSRDLCAERAKVAIASEALQRIDREFMHSDECPCSDDDDIDGCKCAKAITAESLAALQSTEALVENPPRCGAGVRGASTQIWVGCGRVLTPRKVRGDGMSRVVSSEVLSRLQCVNSRKMRHYVLHTLYLDCGHEVMRLSGPRARFKFVLCKQCEQGRKANS